MLYILVLLVGKRDGAGFTLAHCMISCVKRMCEVSRIYIIIIPAD